LPDIKTVLLVEDDNSTLLLESHLIEKLGFNLVSVSSGEKAIEIAARKKFDLALLDIYLGTGIDGIETARRLLEIRKLPIIFFTSHSEQEVVEKVREIPHQGYITKNSGYFVLKSAIEKAIELFETNRDNENNLNALRELNSRQEDLLQAIDNSSALIFTKDSSGRYTYVNRQVRNFFAASLEEIIGKTDADFFDAVTASAINNSDCNVLECGKLECEEVLVSTRDGRARTFLTTKIPLFSRDGIIRGICGTSTDITELKLKEEQKLKLIESRFSSLLNTVKNGFFILDSKFNIIETNDAFCLMSGYSKKELLEMELFDIEYCESPEQSHKHAQKVMREGFDRFETTHRRKDGSVYDAEINVTYEPKSHQFLIFVTDITGRKAAEKKLAANNAILKILHDISKLLLKDLDWQKNVDKILMWLGRSVGASHAYIFELFDGHNGIWLADRFYEWPGGKFSSGQGPFHELSFDQYQFGSRFEDILNGVTFSMNYSQLPGYVKTIFEDRGSKSFIIIPIVIENMTWGFLKFDDRTSDRCWDETEIDLFKSVASLIGMAILHERGKIKLLNNEKNISAMAHSIMTLEENRSDAEAINEIFRAVHTLKSATAMLGIKNMSDVAHILESMLDRVRNGLEIIDEERIDLLFEVLKFFEECLKSIKNGIKPALGNSAVKERINKLKYDVPEKKLTRTVDVKTEKFHVTSYENLVIKEKITGGMKPYTILVEFAADLPMKMVNAFLLFKNLKEYGEVVKTIPTMEEIDNGNFEMHFKILYLASHMEDEFRKALASEEIKNYEVSIFDEL